MKYILVWQTCGEMATLLNKLPTLGLIFFNDCLQQKRQCAVNRKGKKKKIKFCSQHQFTDTALVTFLVLNC